MAVGIFVARILGPEQLGVYAFLMVLNMTLVPTVNFGLPIGINYYLNRGEYTPQEVAFSSVFVGLTQGVVTACIVWLAWQLDLLGQTMKSASPGLVYAVLFLMPLVGIDSAANGFFRGANSFHTVNAIDGFTSFLTPMLLLCLVVLGGAGLGGVVAVQWIKVAVSVIAELWIMTRRHRPHWHVRFDYLKKCLRYGIAGWAGTAVFVLNARLDQLILGMFLGAGDLGRYSVAVAWTGKLLILPNSIGPVLFNRVASEKSSTNARLVTERVHRLLFALMAALGLGMAMLGWLLVPLLYGKDFTESATYLLLLLPGTLGLVSTKVLTKYLSGGGKPGYASYAAIVGSVMGIAGYFLLIPTLGPVGVALATTGSHLAMGMMCMCFYRRMIRPAKSSLWQLNSEDLGWLRGQLLRLSKRIPILRSRFGARAACMVNTSGSNVG